jgi:prepilin-type processing-associated H-X9-DG protein
MYRDQNGNAYPNAAQLPDPAISSRPSLVTYLANYCENNVQTFNCPMDVGTPGTPPTPSCFDKYGISYEYPAVMFANYTEEQVEGMQRKGSSAIIVLYDYGSFHGSDAGINFLFCDGHVSN